MPLLPYCRRSTDKQEGSIEAQEKTIREFIGTQGWMEPDRFYSDSGLSRDSNPLDRPGFVELLDVARRGDTIVVARWDRLGEIKWANLLLSELTRRGIKVVSVNGDSRDTPEAELFRNIQLSFSAYELSRIRTKTKAALQAKKERGEKFCKRLYGFKAVDGRFESDPEELEVAQEILFEVRRGTAFNQIAKELNERCVPSPGGGVWRHSTIKRISERMQVQ